MGMGATQNLHKNIAHEMEFGENMECLIYKWVLPWTKSIFLAR